jgi:uncharacterized protein YjbI with pentapeptide repeats
MATQYPKIGELIGCLCGLPACLWHAFVRQPRTCWVAKHRGRGADLRHARFYSVSLPGVCLEGADLSRAHFLRTDLHGADLRGGNLSWACLMEADLHDADLSHANLSAAQLHGAKLQGASLRGADLRAACLTATDLRNADLRGVDLTKATLQLLHGLTPEQQQLLGKPAPTSLAGTDLTDAILIGVDLLDVDLSGTTLSRVRADALTRWPKGFDPRQHGIEIPPLAAEWQLKRDEVVLGTLRDCHLDYGSALTWCRGHFAPTTAFETVQPLFEEAERRRQARHGEEFVKAVEAIHALKLRLESPAGEILHPDSLQIADEQAWFRY